MGRAGSGTAGPGGGAARSEWAQRGDGGQRGPARGGGGRGCGADGCRSVGRARGRGGGRRHAITRRAPFRVRSPSPFLVRSPSPFRVKESRVISESIAPPPRPVSPVTPAPLLRAAGAEPGSGLGPWADATAEPGSAGPIIPDATAGPGSAGLQGPSYQDGTADGRWLLQAVPALQCRALSNACSMLSCSTVLLRRADTLCCSALLCCSAVPNGRVDSLLLRSARPEAGRLRQSPPHPARTSFHGAQARSTLEPCLISCARKRVLVYIHAARLDTAPAPADAASLRRRMRTAIGPRCGNLSRMGGARVSE
jgi:hypothetical protein